MDEETLDTAMGALTGLLASNRLLGVISHVAELRSRMPARIEVGVGASGAGIKVRG